ncbi:hypothetical protein ACT18_18880 [Mycolicibacter kumamotonensis]|jgi:hypothetical protein|uniref:Uncharacterized protein n=2 Tax=Mycolicibacter kumamotonensis TaxID=354243 RepID=A0A1B8SBU9_9MYCO|nr:hypothetical protein ACT18_18880 [Mycolicibacter kumamotonensis]
MVVIQGHQLFADELTRLAGEISDPGLSSIAADVGAPLQVAVRGRRGVGRRTVAAALAAAGVCVADRPGAPADAVVYVVAEAVKPEDTAAVRAARPRPVLVVLNKADLAGHCGVTAVAAATGAPAESMSALFALAALGRLDGGLWAALRGVAARPADVSCAERFAECPHGVPRPVRRRLCDTVDLSGIERLLELARRGGTVMQARTTLRRLSGVDGVVARLAGLGAGVRHRGISEAVARLEALAVGRDFAGRVDEFLTCEATVAARMAAAEAAVGELRPPGEPVLRRACRWQNYRRGPVGVAERACAGDITRGSLRAWAATRSRS